MYVAQAHHSPAGVSVPEGQVDYSPRPSLDGMGLRFVADAADWEVLLQADSVVVRDDSGVTVWKGKPSVLRQMAIEDSLAAEARSNTSFYSDE